MHPATKCSLLALATLVGSIAAIFAADEVGLPSELATIFLFFVMGAYILSILGGIAAIFGRELTVGQRSFSLGIFVGFLLLLAVSAWAVFQELSRLS